MQPWSLTSDQKRIRVLGHHKQKNIGRWFILKAIISGVLMGLFGELAVKNWFVAVKGWKGGCRNPNPVLFNHDSVPFPLIIDFFMNWVYKYYLFRFSWCKQIHSTRLACVPPSFKVWTFVTCQHQLGVFTGILPAKLCLLICKARLSLCKRDAFWVHWRPGNKHFPLLPSPWQASDSYLNANCH